VSYDPDFDGGCVRLCVLAGAMAGKSSHREFRVDTTFSPFSALPAKHPRTKPQPPGGIELIGGPDEPSCGAWAKRLLWIAERNFARRISHRTHISETGPTLCSASGRSIRSFHIAADGVAIYRTTRIIAVASRE
jgi:hypothetical protein